MNVNKLIIVISTILILAVVIDGRIAGTNDATCGSISCNLTDDLSYQFISLNFDGTTGFEDGTDDTGAGVTPGDSINLTNLNVSGYLIFSGLINCDTIDSDANGLLSCGSDGGGAGGGNTTKEIRDTINSSGTFYNISIPCDLITGSPDTDFCTDASAATGHDHDQDINSTSNYNASVFTAQNLSTTVFNANSNIVVNSNIITMDADLISITKMQDLGYIDLLAAGLIDFGGSNLFTISGGGGELYMGTSNPYEHIKIEYVKFNHSAVYSDTLYDYDLGLPGSPWLTVYSKEYYRDNETIQEHINTSGTFYNISIPCDLISGSPDTDFCTDADSGGATGHEHDQDLNITDAPTFSALNLTGSFFINLSTENQLNFSAGGNPRGFFYDATKRALRIGSETWDSWDPSQIGEQSFQVGSGIVNGSESIGFGHDHVVSGAFSYSFQEENTMYGDRGFAIGADLETNGENVFAWGYNATIDSDQTVYFGRVTNAQVNKKDSFIINGMTIGINTTNPTSTLEVAGSFNASSISIGNIGVLTNLTMNKTLYESGTNITITNNVISLALTSLVEYLRTLFQSIGGVYKSENATVDYTTMHTFDNHSAFGFALSDGINNLSMQEIDDNMGNFSEAQPSLWGIGNSTEQGYVTNGTINKSVDLSDITVNTNFNITVNNITNSHNNGIRSNSTTLILYAGTTEIRIHK